MRAIQLRSFTLQMLSLEIRRILNYRFDFWVDFLGSIIGEMGVAYCLWTAVYTATGQTLVGGYTLSAMMFYYFLAPIISRITHPNHNPAASSHIYSGDLNKHLIYPVPYFYTLILNVIAGWGVGVVRLLVAWFLVLAIFEGPPGATGLAPVCMGIVATLASTLLGFAILTSLGLVAFWVENIWSLSVTISLGIAGLGGGLIPLELFNPAWQSVLKKLPFWLIQGFPISCFMAKVTWTDFYQHCALILVWSLLFAVLIRIVWLRGLKHYSGVGI